MAQKPMELILMRQLASCLSMPVFIVDADGVLIFFNEPAELMLGRRFEDTGEMPSGDFAARFANGNAEGASSAPAELPIAVALREGRPVSGVLTVTGTDNKRRQVEVTAVPLVGQGDRSLGAAAIVYVR